MRYDLIVGVNAHDVWLFVNGYSSLLVCLVLECTEIGVYEEQGREEGHSKGQCWYDYKKIRMLMGPLQYRNYC